MNDYRLESPPILRDFLSYHETIKAHSQKTVDEYFLDLRNFFRYLKQSHDPSLRDLPLSEISIMDVDLDFVKKVTLTDIYAYMTYLSRDRVQHQNSDVSDYGLNAASRARKIATIRSFYNYLVNKAHLLDTNPCKDLDSPKIKKSLPKYLTLDESVQLLQSVDGQNRERDYCILTIFLNCGLRISELCGLDLQDIQDDALRVLGKGNKVRIVYRPNCVIDFDPSLKELGIDSAEGARPGATLVVNTNDASYVNEAFGHVTRIDADKITHELLGEVPPNVAMLGALAKATDCVSLDSLRKAVQMKIPGKAGEMNAETCAAAYRNA